MGVSLALLFAFDLLKLGGKDLRRVPLEERKRELTKLLRKSAWALQLNEYIDEPGEVVFKHACKLGLEGIVSKRLGSTYRSGSNARLDQEQESGCASHQTRSRGRLGTVSRCY